MPIQDDIAGLGSLIQNEFTNVTPTNKISADDVKNLATKTVSIATEIGAKLVENDTIDASQTATDVTHDAKIAALEGAKTANDVTDASQGSDIADLKSAKTANDAINATQSSDIAALKVVSKQAAQVFFVDRRYTSQAEMEAQDAEAVQGSMEKPFATPYSAKKAAIAWLAANLTEQAIVEIARGNTYGLSDYVPALHDVVVSITGVDYVSGVELAYHGITYVMYGVTIETPIMNPVFLSAQANARLSTKNVMFFGGSISDTGVNLHAEASIEVSVDEIFNSRVVAMEAGINSLQVKKLHSEISVGDRRAGQGNSAIRKNIAISAELQIVPVGKKSIDIEKLHNKTLTHTISTCENVHRGLMDIGQGSGVCADGTLSGLDHSHARIDIGVVRVMDGYVYRQDGGGGFINITNNRNSTLTTTLHSLGKLSVPKFLWIYGIQEGNRYHITGEFVKIDNPTSVEMPFSLALDASVLILKDFSLESNVLNTIFTVVSGKVVLKNCVIRQSAQGQSMFNIAEGATVTAENCHFLMSDRITPLTTGTGKLVSKNSTSNVAFGTAVLKGDLKVSKWYDETLNQTENWKSVTGSTIIPNPDRLRMIVKTDVNTAVEVGQTKFFNGLILMGGDNGTTVAVIESSASGITVTQDSGKVFEYALISTNYILGA